MKSITESYYHGYGYDDGYEGKEKNPPNEYYIKSYYEGYERGKAAAEQPDLMSDVPDEMPLTDWLNLFSIRSGIKITMSGICNYLTTSLEGFKERK
jgi:hypothetical protein